MEKTAKENVIEMDETYHVSKQILDEIKKQEVYWKNFCEGSDGYRAVIMFEEYTAFLTDADIKFVADKIEKESDADSVTSMTHSMCHVYEHGVMADPKYREFGDIVLDKLIEKAEQGYFAHASRSIAAYWNSVKDTPEAWNGLRAVLEKHPHYAYGQKYLGYMNGEEPEDQTALRQKWIEDPNMLFVSTDLVDIDGTLIQNGRLNDKVFRQVYYDPEIYTGGDPETQREKLLEVSVKTILEDYALDEKLSAEKIINAYKSDADEIGIIKAIYVSIDPETREAEGNALINKLMNWSRFVKKLADGSTPIYPKEAFTQDNICLAGEIIDDTQPEAQGIKSLLPATLNPEEEDTRALSYRIREKIPSEQIITAEKAVEMFREKQGGQGNTTRGNGFVNCVNGGKDDR